MATKFLRKIILEELQKVLKEEAAVGTNIGQKPGATIIDKDELTMKGAGSGTPSQNRRAREMVEKSQGRMSYDQAIAVVKAQDKSFNFGGISSLAAQEEAASGQKRAAVKNLQMQMVKRRALQPNEAVGNFGPKTRAYINTFFGVSDQEGITEKDATMMTAAEITDLTKALEANNPIAGKQALAKYHMRVNKGFQAADVASSQSGKTKLAADLAAANQGRGPADVVLNTDTPLDKKRGVATPPEPSSDELGQRMLQGQRDLDRKMNEPPTKINVPKTSFKRQEESIAREIKKLLRSI